jgi:hypothetical protein
MWHRDYSIILECDEYVNPANEDECGLVEVFVRAYFDDDILQNIEVRRVESLDEDRQLITLAKRDMRRALKYAEIRALDRGAEWQSEYRLCELNQKAEWAVEEGKL